MAGSSHGHTPAAWTGVIISFVGFCAGGVFMVGDQPVLFWVSVGIIVLGAVVGFALKIMGKGTPAESDEMKRARAAAAESARARLAGGPYRKQAVPVVGAAAEPAPSAVREADSEAHAQA